MMDVAPSPGPVPFCGRGGEDAPVVKERRRGNEIRQRVVISHA